MFALELAFRFESTIFFLFIQNHTSLFSKNLDSQILEHSINHEMRHILIERFIISSDFFGDCDD
jgi:hypothetical protein